MTRHPSEYFIKYLLTLDDAPGPDEVHKWVNTQLKELGLPEIKKDQVKAIRQRMHPPKGFSPRRPDHRASMAFLRKERIHGLHYPDHHATICKFILGTPNVRDLVETLLLGGHEPAVIARTVNRKIGEGLLVTKAVELFRHYFWNTDLLTKGEWGKLLFGKHGSAGRRSALLGGQDVAMFRIGVERQLESRKIMQRVQAGLYLSFLETEAMDMSRDKVEMQVGLATSLTKVDERLAQSDLAMQEVLDKFERFRMANRPTSIKSADELTKGQYNEPGRKLLGPAHESS